MFGVPAQYRESPWKVARQQDFTAGMNSYTNPDLSNINTLRLVVRGEISKEGYLKKGKGYTALFTNSGAVQFQAIALYSKSDGNFYIITRDDANNVKAFSWDGSSTIDFATPIATKAGVTGTLGKFYWVVWRDVIIMGTDLVAPFHFNGTTFTNCAGSPPIMIGLKVYADKLWGIEVANPSRLRFSALENYDSWDALDMINVRTNDGSILTQISPQPGGLVIFKERNVFALYGRTRFDIQISEAPIMPGTGCPSQLRGAVLDEGFFMGTDNVFQFNLQGGTPILPPDEFKRIGNGWEETQTKYAVGGFSKRTGMVWFGVMVQNYPVLNINLKYKSVSYGFTIGSAALLTIVDLDYPGMASKYKVAVINGWGSYPAPNWKVMLLDDTVVDTTTRFYMTTRFNDFGSTNDKVFHKVTVVVSNAVSQAWIGYKKDQSLTDYTQLYSGALVAGENHFRMYGIVAQSLALQVETDNDIEVRELRAVYRFKGRDRR